MSDLGVYTVEEAIEHIGFGPFQILIVVFTGMIWLSDAMEAMLLSVLAPILKCEWNLASWQEAMLTSVVFMGFLFGGYFWGLLADSIGRKKSLLIVGCIVFAFGQLSAIAPNYPWFLFFRFIVGFAIAGSSQAVTYYVEFLSSKLRGLCIMLLALWWAVGSMSAALLALVIIPNLSDPLNWRLYLCLCAIPIGTVMTLFIFVPESARYYVLKGKMVKGEKVIRHIAWFNRKKPPSGRLVSQEEKDRLEAEIKKDITFDEENKETAMDEDEDDLKDKSSCSAKEKEPFLGKKETPPPPYQHHTAHPISEGDSSDSNSSNNNTSSVKRCTRKYKVAMVDSFESIKSLFTDKGWSTTIPLLLIWLGCAWSYYGSVILATTILEDGHNPRCGSKKNDSSDDDGCDLSTSFYLKIVWTSAAEFPGILLTLVIIEFIGRKKAMAIEFAGAALSIGLLLICVPEVYTALFLFSARGFLSGGFQAVYVYTPEVYPTKSRGLALGLMSSAARLGALVTPFIAQPLYDVNDIATVVMYSGSCVLLTVLALLLPIETKGRSLKDS